MANDDELKIKITLDGDSAKKNADEVKRKLTEVGDEANKTGTKLDLLASRAGKAAIAIGAIAAGGAVVKSLADLGDEISDAREGLQELSKDSGITAEALTKKLSAATKGAISDLQLFQLANRGLQIGVLAKDLDSVAAAAQRYSERMGGDVPRAMEKLVNAINTGREAELRRFGTLKDGTLILNGYQDSLGGVSDETNRIGTALQNFRGQLGELFDKMSGVADLARLFAEAITTLGNAFITVLTPAIQAVDAILGALAAGIRATIKDFMLLGETISQFANGGFSAIDFVEAYGNVTKRLEEKTIKSTGAQIKLQKSIDKSAEAAKKAESKFKDFSDSLFRELFPGSSTFPIELYNKHLDTLQKALTAGKEGSAAFTKIIKEQADAWEAAGGSLEDYIRDLQQTKEIANATQGGIFPTANISGGQETKSLGLEIGQAIAEGIGDALQIAFSKGAKSQDWGNALGSLAGKTANIAATSALKDTLGDFAPIAGEIAGSLVTELSGALVSAFGGKDTPGTTARKAADKWFAELFDAERLAVVVKGEMKRIDDLVFKGQSPFGGNISGFAKDNNGFAALLGLDAASQGGFTAVGTALENLLGVAKDISGQIAAVLVNNIGGSLQNLQVLVQQTGFTFEEMSNAIVESFYAGQLSIQETATALANLQGIFEVGIPGAIGAVNEAWANFEASVAEGKGSRFLIDSIRDIGAEAQELGISTFPQLADQLVRVFGFSANQVTAFFEAMKAVGIQNIQELVNASTENLINLAANYQQIIQGLSPGFGPAATDATRTAQVRYPSTRLSTPKIAKDPAKVKDSFDASKDSVKVLSKLFRTFEGDLKAIGAAADLIGISMKDLESSITKAFKRGEIGAKEALNQFKKYKDAFTSGIAGKTGAVGEAIQNLIKTGAQGGVLTLNAFKGILTEAKEGRVSTLGGLVDIFRQQLGEGASDKLREALKGEGINSFKALQEASEDTIVRILGNMEKLGFPFETTSKKTKDLLKEINKIGKTPPQEIKVVLKIKAEATDKNSAKVLNALPEVGRSIKKLINTGQGIELQ